MTIFTGVSFLPEQWKNNFSLAGYPLYPAIDDIYNKFLEEKELNPEDPSKIKDENTELLSDEVSELDFEKSTDGSELDVPGSELDDQQEEIGNEDEENNYYSLGSDDHNDLDENNG